MRTYDEILADILVATERHEALRLRDLADELQILGTPEAEALAFDTRGLSLNLTGHVAEALELYERALLIAQPLDDLVLKAKITGHLGLAHHGMGNFPKALECFIESRSMFHELGDYESEAKASSNIGVIHFVMGNYTAALEHYNQVLGIFTEIGDRNGMARATGNIGVVYANTGAHPEALDYYYKALAIHEELGNRNLVAVMTDNIGLVYSHTESHDQALDHFQRALAIFEELGNRAGQAQVIDHIGTVHFQQKSFQEALEHYERARTIYEELGDRAGVAVETGSIANALVRLERYDEARPIVAAYNEMDVFDPRYRVGRCLLNARLLEIDGHIDDAVTKYRDALEIAKEHGLRLEMGNIHEALRDLAKKQNDFAAYIEHNEAFMKITDEVRGREATERMAMQEAERKMASERQERDKERAVLYSTLPKHIADRVVRGEKVSGDHYDAAAVIFLDIVDFTSISDRLPAYEVVQLLEKVFTMFDNVCRKHDVTKIKTIGDSYMAVAFEEQPNNRTAEQPNSARRAAACALDMIDIISTVTLPPEGSPERSPEGSPARSPVGSPVRVRIGVHFGPVTAGVIGTERLQYDVWGDTVNVASRLENTSSPGRIHVSNDVAKALGEPSPGTWHLAPRGEIELKGKGEMLTFWLERQ